MTAYPVPAPIYDWPMLPTFFAQRISEEEFECMIERRVDFADALLMANKVSQEDYDTRMRQINAWSDDIYKAGRIKSAA